MNRHFVITLATVASLAACGGSSTSDGQSSGGTSGSGNGSGAAGTSGASGAGGASGGGGAGGACPVTFPQHASACAPNGLTCSYDQGPCCPPLQATCVDGQWQAYATGCAAPPPEACPLEPPVDGSACGGLCSGEPQYCTYGLCSDGSPATMAQCSGGVWSVSFANCLSQCEGLSPCECFDRSDCQPVTDTCICPCDYACPGKPPCDCDCGGGAYLGCKSIANPGG